MKKRLWRIITGAILFITAILLALIQPQLPIIVGFNYQWIQNAAVIFQWIRISLYIISYIITGGDVIRKAIQNIFKGKVFDESFLMSIATVGAFLIGEYPEGVAVMLFYQIGELFQSYAVDKSRKSIASLMDIRPDYANLIKGDELVKVAPNEVQIGDIILIKAGEKVPLDGKVIDGNSFIDMSALTGESVPREVEAGSEIISGSININGVITVEVTKEYEESTVNKILDLVEYASSNKSKSERFITRFAQYYTPVVVIAAVLLAFIPPIISTASLSDWIYRALSFLVMSCPCALVISIPLSFFGGIGGASKKGILVKGGNYLEALAKADIVVFDKTGTLTKGVFEVQEIHAEEGFSKATLLKLAAHAESYSNHPIALSLRRAYGEQTDNDIIISAEEIPGHGVNAMIDGKKVLVGNDKLMDKMNIRYIANNSGGTIVHIAIDNTYAGYIVIADVIKDDSGQAIKDLKNAGIKKIVMLTGDSKSAGEKVAKDLEFDSVYTQLLPVDKVKMVEVLFGQKSPNGKLAFVGDGINDAPVLALADIGIAMGGLGSDAAIEASDIVIMTDEPSKITTAIRISKKTLKIAYQNIVFAIGIKAAVLILSALGLTTMWAAIFADVGVTCLAVLNAFRGMSVKKL